ncbi:SDR family oxidoreductase [Pigmentiphaga litoralis]|uniref:3-oxoacyl-[acyl-carrier protein] reductase n=1 Tax=Pigmentiphaga litoralis TaxID=516702 RepID=A0A7Y9IUA8_9BURK|nr:SDR family oxidoreductase [Pigmentiphaga litoralis]NYE23153.1 3-oxoacyl-[acyl-carrier protein] reductase [Pigmentiphaga litoralis]NYE83232.1 3-oxoacyl-[acyl-carrier protein] reductase [Pigmentiphaga litoralis]
MDLGIKGKTALVTASSAGLGKNTAHALAAEGANIVLFARSADALQTVADEIAGTHGVRVLPVRGDMLSSADVDALAAAIAAEFGGLDILVLNTGRAPNPLRATVDETEEARWHAAYNNQLWGAIQVAKTVIPLMRGRGWGRIVAITSASVKSPMPHHSLSTVFRAGMTAYIKHLANEIGAEGITANCVAPALIDTSHRVGAAAYTPEQAAARKKLTPLGRMGRQEELTGVVTFLTSMQAGFITGSTILVEGGMVGSLI